MWRWADEEEDYVWYAVAVFFVIVTIVAAILGATGCQWQARLWGLWFGLCTAWRVGCASAESRLAPSPVLLSGLTNLRHRQSQLDATKSHEGATSRMPNGRSDITVD